MLPEIRTRYETEEQLRIDAEVGRGGYGHVYRAHHLRLDTPVAVKVLNTQLQAMPALLKLFAREARVLARIDHPNVLRVFDYGEGPEGPYIVTEWMSGGAVDSAADEVRLRTIASSTASALQALHEAAILHRDIKPANLFWRDDGRIKVGDLGVALAPENSADRAQFVGTVPYMAPELFDDPPSYSPASDVYALGVSLYQLWSGTLPFHAFDVSELASLIQSAVPKPLPSLRGGLSASLVRLLEKMMERRAESRPSAREVVKEITTRSGLVGATSTPVAAPTAVAVGTPPASMSDVVHVGPWVVTQEMMRGNAWQLFFAHHGDTGRQVRIGRLLGTWLIPSDALLEAAQRCSRWSHPNMVTVLDWGTWAERPYFACEMIGVRFLDTVQGHGPISEVDALRLVEQIADVVAYVHERGYVFQMVDANAVGSRPNADGWMLDWSAFSAKIGSKATKERRYISPFTAPEIESSAVFAAAADVYGLGSLLAFAITGSSDLGVLTRSPRIVAATTAATRSLIAALTAPNPKERPTAIEARDWAAVIRRRLAPVGD